MSSKKWSRRGFTKAVISAQALIASGGLALQLGCDNSKKPLVDSSLNSQRQEVIKSAMDVIIPSSDKMPSASQVGGLNYILNILNELPELEPLFVSISDKIESQSHQEFGSNFIKLDENKRFEVLTVIERSEPQLFKVIKDFTYESYYTNKEVYQLIEYNPYPTGSSGPDMKPFDPKLLDRVRTSPPFYTKI